jgi:hypothetical protein
VPACTRFAEHNGAAGGTTDVCIRRILENLFNLFLGQPMLGTMLDISIGIIVKVPNDRLLWHGLPLLVW